MEIKTKSGVISNGHKWVLYGPPGTGKTTTASNAPNPIFFDIEDGSSALDVDRFQFHDGADGHVPRSLAEVYAGIDALTKLDHEYATLVIDGLGVLESLIAEHCCRRDRKRNLEDYGPYKAGWNVARDELRVMLLRLNTLRAAKHMDIIILGHASVKQHKDPDREPYDQFVLQADNRASQELSGWCDFMGFVSFHDVAVYDKRSKKYKGQGDNTRTVRFGHSATIMAKSRVPVQNEIILDPIEPWRDIRKLVATASKLTGKKLADAVMAEAERIGDPELTSKVEATVKKTTDEAKLRRYLDSLRERPTLTPQEADNVE